MQPLIFAAVLIGTHLALMQVFRLTTYHAYFWRALPLLLLYAGFVGWLLYALKLHAFFLWFVALESVWLFTLARKQAKAAEAMFAIAGNDANLARGMAVSTAKTKTFYAVSSFVYVVTASVAYLALYNR